MDYQQTIQHYSGAVYGGVQKLVEFLENLSRMHSPMEIAGRAQISPIEEVVYQQSQKYPPIPQSTYPTHVQNGWHRVTPYHPTSDSKNSKGTHIYFGGRATRSRRIYEARQNGKQNKKPVRISKVRESKVKGKNERHSRIIYQTLPFSQYWRNF